MQVVPLKNKQGKVANNKMKTWLWQIWTERTLYGDSWSFTKRDWMAANVVNWSEAGLSRETREVKRPSTTALDARSVWLYTQNSGIWGLSFPFHNCMSLTKGSTPKVEMVIPFPCLWNDISLLIYLAHNSTNLSFSGCFCFFSIKKHKTLEEFKMLAWNF